MVPPSRLARAGWPDPPLLPPVRLDARDDHAPRPGDDAAGIPALPVAGLDRHLPAALGAGLLRERLLHLPAAPVLPHDPRRALRRRPHRRLRRVVDLLARHAPPRAP